MALTPTYFYVKRVSRHGMAFDDIHKAIYNLWKAVSAICYNIDEDIGRTGEDYMDNIGTDLDTAMAQWQTPNQGNSV